MKILVQKFGGTSLRNEQVRQRAVHHIQKARREKYGVVVVVSAMGRIGEPYATDSLLAWIEQNGNRLSARDRDLLLSCGEMIAAATLSSLLGREEIPSIVLTGFQAGIITNDDFGNAEIISVNPKRIRQELDQGQVVIVCGFQGGTRKGEVTTLGRGGSDTTATALGSALKAEAVDIFTDVDGIMTADPRVVENAAFLERVTYTEMCHLAYQGAKVVHPRAVEIAMQSQIPIRVRSVFSDKAGTLVTSAPTHPQEKQIQDRLVTGIAHVGHLTQIKVSSVQTDHDLQMHVFQAMAANKISVDFINVTPSGVVYTVFDDLTDKAVSILQSMGYQPAVNRQCAKVSLVGAGMAGVPGVMAKIVETLMTEDIHILQSADSHTTIWVLVKEMDMIRAVNALHRAFQLDRA